MNSYEYKEGYDAGYAAAYNELRELAYAKLAQARSHYGIQMSDLANSSIQVGAKGLENYSDRANYGAVGPMGPSVVFDGDTSDMTDADFKDVIKQATGVNNVPYTVKSAPMSAPEFDDHHPHVCACKRESKSTGAFGITGLM